MIKKILTIWLWDEKYEEEFLFPAEIKPTKATNLVTVIATARNGLAVGHRFRGDVGELR